MRSLIVHIAIKPKSHSEWSSEFSDNFEGNGCFGYSAAIMKQVVGYDISAPTFVQAHSLSISVELGVKSIQEATLRHTYI